MLKMLKRCGLATVLVAASFAVATTAEARHRDRGDDTSAIAIGAGIVGLAVGALFADRDDGNYYDRDYYRHRRYVRVSGYPDYYYYYDGYPNRYYRDRHYDRHYGQYYGRRHDNRWDRGYYGNRWNRGYDRSHRRYRHGNRDGYHGHHRGNFRDRWDD